PPPRRIGLRRTVSNRSENDMKSRTRTRRSRRRISFAGNVSQVPHLSKQHPRMNVRAMHGRVATRAPARALSQTRRVRSVPDVDLAWLPLHLGVAFQTKIGVALHEHFAIDRSMRRVADDAAFA